MTSENWKPIVGYEGLYEVSDLGRVRSIPRLDSRKHPRGGIVMKATVNCSHGYLDIGLMKNGKKTRYRVHRLVLEAFVGPCPVGMQGCHRDDNRQNAKLSNLRWGTPESNVFDKVSKNRQARGETNRGGGKLKDAQVIEIKRRLPLEKNSSLIGRDYGVSGETIRAIRSGKIWRHIHG